LKKKNGKKKKHRNNPITRELVPLQFKVSLLLRFDFSFLFFFFSSMLNFFEFLELGLFVVSSKKRNINKQPFFSF